MSDDRDWRNITTGWEIPTENYCDQPYVVKTDDGAWLCVVTTGPGREGQPGQHIVTLRSTDCGRTWSAPVDVEPTDGPEASYAVPLKVPGGRVYCFYNHNTDNVRAVKADDPPFAGGLCRRVDSLGYFVFKYSDDHGRTWSDRRYPIDVREMAIDRENPYGGKVRYFWNVGKAFCHDGAAFVPLHKVGGFGEGFFTRSEGVLLKSTDLLTERDPAKITWQTLPEGDAGLRAPRGGGPIAEEQSFCVLSDGSLYCIYRTIDGHPACTYSRDGGRTWAEPQYQRYADGRPMKHPRAANFVWRLANGNYLYWFHNNGTKWYNSGPSAGNRNPVWLCGGIEADAPDGRVIRWSQPEIALYDDDPFCGMSYPDLIEEDGRVFLTETQKTIARVHEIDRTLLAGLWDQFETRCVATGGLVLSLAREAGGPGETQTPSLPGFAAPRGFRTENPRPGLTVDLRIRLDSLDPGQIVLDNRAESGAGICLRTTDRRALEIVLSDGRTASCWACDPGLVTEGRLHHVAVIVDAGPRIITFVVDGILCDGGPLRPFGWGRFSPNLRHANGDKILRIGPRLRGGFKALRIYDRYLRTSEAISNYRAGR